VVSELKKFVELRRKLFNLSKQLKTSKKFTLEWARIEKAIEDTRKELQQLQGKSKPYEPLV